MLEKKLEKYCRYYKGEEECPFEYDTPAYHFWHFEKMFYAERDDEGRNGWIPSDGEKHSEEYNFLENDEFNDVEKGFLLFAYEMTAKWMPYDTAMIYEYGKGK